ncbi:hypothetical protein O6H91_18G028300 [Diphasiastrum complanatum]|uniref:Uncharacterized protein n=1 Tax=Diphasiastrum complanatum TaxID=34168 RepID=A0ACC2AZ67_DIPCM|nr:hypothetical protein O6H91_18G028300 [Diphasiastrum complanatum]
MALSSTEAEYLGLCDASKKYLWTSSLLKEFHIEQKIVFLTDNQGCLLLTKNFGFHKRNKHICIQYHFVQDLVQENQLTVPFCLP